MDCPACHGPTRVVESRSAEDGTAIRRRRECARCERRFTTFERAAPAALHIEKRSGQRQPFDRQKLLDALRRAAHKRPVEPAALDALADRIEAEMRSAGGELPSERVGEICLEELARLDRGAYLQFAGVFDADGVRAEPALIAANAGAGSIRDARDDPALPRETS